VYISAQSRLWEEKGSSGGGLHRALAADFGGVARGHTCSMFVLGLSVPLG
jgi:hypothetical protein